MESFNYKDKIVHFWEVTGEVIGNNKYSETFVSSTGGGGYVDRYGAHISPPTIQSSTVTNHEFWIKTNDGLEKDIKLRGIDIPLRQGQKITLISAGIKGKDTGWYSILINHSAGKHWFITDAAELDKKLELEPHTGKTLLIASLIVASIGLIGTGKHWEDAFSIGAFFIAVRFVLKIRKTLKLHESLKQHLEDLAQKAYKKS